jgi:zinc-ribbon domain
MLSKTVCSNCGADNAPDGARFCPSCGLGLSNSRDEIPMAAATPLNDDPLPIASVSATSVEPSTVTFDEPPMAPGTDQQHPQPSYTTESPGENIYCANYFLNPTSDMVERAQTQAMGGILFIGTFGLLEGKLTLAKEIAVGRILGGDKIDLSYADFVHPVTTITTGTILGGLKVIVPRGVRVETRGLGILGGFKGLNGQTVHAGQEAPLVVIQGLSILGGVKVDLNERAPPLRIIK